MLAPRQPLQSDVLRPGQALLSPVWLLALLLLLANDHWLKHAGVLPSALTGKLSDIAGLLLAPCLFALLVGARRRASVAACHVAVAVVFAGIQLSPACAAAWSWTMGVLGHPWTITRDLSDLLALPVLGLSWYWLVPQMDPARGVRVPLRRSAVAGLSVLGLWASVATTDRPEPEVVREPVFGNWVINNANDFDITFSIRWLRDDLLLDCAEIDHDPGRLLDSAAFGDVVLSDLPARTNFAISLDFERGCDAVWVDGEGIDPTILFSAHPFTYPFNAFDSSTDDPSTLPLGGLALVLGDNGSSWIGGDDIRFTPKTDTPTPPSSCEPPGGETRIVWSDPVPENPAEILSLELGVDGCYAFELQEYATSGNGPMPSGSSYLWNLCVPSTAMPFMPGEFVRIELVSGSQGTSELDLLLLDPTTLVGAVDDSGAVLRQIRLLHAGTDPKFIGPAISRELEALVDDACPWLLEAGCATAERAVKLRVVGATDPIDVDVPVAFADPPGPGARVHTLVLGYARQRAVLDPECVDGATAMAYDIDLALIDEPLL